MKYAEAMEFSRLLNFDPEVAYAESFKRAYAAEEAFQKQYAFEATLGAFVDDIDEMHDDNIAIATEAANAVTDAIKKIATWFKNLLVKFKTMIRRIVFKARVKSVKKAIKGSSGAAMAASIDLTDEEVKNYTDAMNQASDSGVKFGVVPKTVTPMYLAKQTQTVFNFAFKVESDLDRALKNPDYSTQVKELNARAKACAASMKVMTALTNKAIKAGVVQVKGAAEPVEGEVVDKSGKPVK